MTASARFSHDDTIDGLVQVSNSAGAEAPSDSSPTHLTENTHLGTLLGIHRQSTKDRRGDQVANGGVMERETLEWSAWCPWGEVFSDTIRVPARPGVYEAKRCDQEIRLTIGQTNLLSRRVSYLVRGDGPHSAGERIRAREDVAHVLVRWALTERHEEVEVQLHREHRDRFGRLPVYTKKTGRARPAGSTSS